MNDFRVGFWGSWGVSDVWGWIARGDYEEIGIRERGGFVVGVVEGFVCVGNVRFVYMLSVWGDKFYG